MTDSTHLAVLIDADNTQPGIIDGLLNEIADYGTASVKRIYGDWTRPNLKGWKETLLDHSIQPIQQFAYTSGKNATDSAMIIDAMDLLYSGKFDGFCIVSSDSDFTRLASRIRESSITVYGFGERKTPKAFVSACDKFVYLDLLDTGAQGESKVKKASVAEFKRNTRLVNLFRSTIDASSDDTGWANLGRVGSNIAKHSPDFDPRNYGYTKLGELVAASKLFQMEERQAANTNFRNLYIKNRTKSK